MSVGRGWDAVLLALLLVGGSGLRAWGLLHGLADDLVYHPDAYYVVHDGWQHALGAPWSAGHFGATYAILVRAAMRVVDGVGRFVGLAPAWSYGLIGAAASALGAALGTLTIPAAYVLGVRGYGRPAGLIGAALLAVCPLHVFHSHYPYRDVPMTLALVLALAGAVAWASTARIAWLGLALVGGVAAAALKTTGFLVVFPLLLAVALTWRHVPRWVGGAAGAAAVGAVLAGVWLHGIPTLPGRAPAALGNPLQVARSLVEFASAYLAAFGGDLAPGLPAAGTLLWRWAGPPAALLALAGVAWALVRRRPADLVLLAFVGPAFVGAAMFRWLDERYLVPLLPATAVLAGRLAAEAWAVPRGRRLVRLAVVAALGVTLGAGAAESAWRGRLLALPDTRALAGRWLEAHVAPTTTIVAEPYGPLGLDTRPNVLVLDMTRPAADEVRRAPLLVTSTLEHQRYLDAPGRHPRAAAFFGQVVATTRPVRRVALAPLGFVHPTIDVRAAGVRVDAPGLPLDLPRPYDHAWNRGLAFVPSGPYDRDDRTVTLGGSRAHAMKLVSPAPLPEVMAFVANGPEPAEVRLQAGGRRVRRALGPGEMTLLRVVPGWTWDRPPVLTPVEVALRPHGATALVQLRVGSREIGQAAVAWGRFADAVRPLGLALRADPGDVPVRLALVRALQETGRAGEARREAADLGPAGLRVIAAYRRLALAEEAGWDARFADETGLSPSLLRRALEVSLEAEDIRAAGHVVGDGVASGGLAVTVAPDPAAPGERVLVNGPARLFLPPGWFRAVFTLRALRAAGGPAGPGSRAALRVFAETTPLAERAVSARDLGAGPAFAEVGVPFRHQRPGARVAVQVAVTGAMEVDRVRIEPDLRGAVQGLDQALARVLAAPE